MWTTVYNFEKPYDERLIETLVEFRHEPTATDENRIAVYSPHTTNCLGCVASHPQFSLLGGALNAEILYQTKGKPSFYGMIQSIQTLPPSSSHPVLFALKVEVQAETSFVEPSSMINWSATFQRLTSDASLSFFKQLTQSFYREDSLYSQFFLNDAFEVCQATTGQCIATIQWFEPTPLLWEQWLPFWHYVKGLSFDILNVTHEQLEIMFHCPLHQLEDWQHFLSIEQYRDILEETLVRTSLSYSTLEHILLTLEQYRVHPDDIRALLTSYCDYPDAIRGRIPSEPQLKYVDSYQLIPKSVAYFNRHRAILLEGPSATGKNTLIETLCWLFQRPLYEISLTRQTSVEDLLGDLTLSTSAPSVSWLPISSQASFEQQWGQWCQNWVLFAQAMTQSGQQIQFKRGILTEAMEVGGVLTLDEVNMATVGITALLHSVLDMRARLFIPHYGQVNAHKNFNIVATMNRGYFGTFELNTAFHQRFTHLHCQYAESLLPLLRQCFPSLGFPILQQVDQFYVHLCQLIQKRKLPESSLNIRGILTALETSTLPLIETLADNLVNALSDDLARETMIQLIQFCFASENTTLSSSNGIENTQEVMNAC